MAFQNPEVNLKHFVPLPPLFQFLNIFTETKYNVRTNTQFDVLQFDCGPQSSQNTPPPPPPSKPHKSNLSDVTHSTDTLFSGSQHTVLDNQRCVGGAGRSRSFTSFRAEGGWRTVAPGGKRGPLGR